MKPTDDFVPAVSPSRQAKDHSLPAVPCPSYRRIFLFLRSRSFMPKDLSPSDLPPFSLLQTVR